MCLAYCVLRLANVFATGIMAQLFAIIQKLNHTPRQRIGYGLPIVGISQPFALYFVVAKPHLYQDGWNAGVANYVPWT